MELFLTLIFYIHFAPDLGEKAYKLQLHVSGKENLLDLFHNKLKLSKELTEMSSNVKKIFVKLYWLKGY